MSSQTEFVKNLTASVRAGNEDAAKLLRDVLTGLVAAAPLRHLALMGDWVQELDYELFKEADKKN